MEEWEKVANIYEKLAEEALATGHLATAHQEYFLASRYYRWSHHLNWKPTPDKERLYQKSRDCFVRSGQLANPSVEEVEIPFNGQSLPGYFYKPDESGNPAPCVILLHIGDASKEESYVMARIFNQRGLACLCYDPPGHGESRLRNILFTLEAFDQAASAVFDYLQTRADVCPEKIGLWGNCYGAHMALRLAALEPRTAASIAISAIHTHEELMPLPPAWIASAMYAIGSNDADRANQEVFSRLSLNGLLSRVVCPILAIHGTEDKLVPMSQVKKIHAELPESKDLRIFEGAGHGCHNVFTTVTMEVGDWMARVLKN